MPFNRPAIPRGAPESRPCPSTALPPPIWIVPPLLDTSVPLPRNAAPWPSPSRSGLMVTAKRPEAPPAGWMPAPLFTTTEPSARRAAVASAAPVFPMVCDTVRSPPAACSVSAPDTLSPTLPAVPTVKEPLLVKLIEPVSPASVPTLLAALARV